MTQNTEKEEFYDLLKELAALYAEKYPTLGDMCGALPEGSESRLLLDYVICLQFVMRGKKKGDAEQIELFAEKARLIADQLNALPDE